MHGARCAGDGVLCTLALTPPPELPSHRQGTYVRIHGHMSSFGREKSFVAFNIRPVTDHNEASGWECGVVGVPDCSEASHCSWRSASASRDRPQRGERECGVVWAVV